MIPNKEFLTVRDIAEMLNLTERTVRALFSKGKIKARKIAGKYVTTADILKHYIEDNEEGV